MKVELIATGYHAEVELFVDGESHGKFNTPKSADIFANKLNIKKSKKDRAALEGASAKKVKSSGMTSSKKLEANK